MLMPVLDPWEPHPIYQGTEIRKCGWDQVLALFPEGDTGAECWVWTLGKKNGCDDDREVARKQAEEAARAAGYQLCEDI